MWKIVKGGLTYILYNFTFHGKRIKKTDCGIAGAVNHRQYVRMAWGQLPEDRKEDKKGVTGQSNNTDTRIGSASGENAEKVGWKPGSVQSIENRQFYKTEEEKRKFIR